ncbi:MAG: phenylalanine--tRNA ligase subunit alpha, partial [Zestosphaera sp.]
ARVEVKDIDVLQRTKKVHVGVWKYNWREDIARMTVLRTHTTPVSLRTIHERGAGEYRVFSFDRVFRPDTPDPTHLMEFHQLEGIIVGKKVTFSELLGFFKELARRLGMEEVRFRPAYFPFTEPSVEGFVKHPKLGWIEVFPGGMFRPEVLASVALPPDYKVAAWGIGIDRLAMIVLGFDDIRNLYSCDLDVIESTKIPEVILRHA